MFNFILSDGNLPFAVALGLMLAIAILEGIMTMLGAGLSQAVDALLPESFGDVEFDANHDLGELDGQGADFGDTHAGGADAGSNSALSKVLGWLRIGQVPILILFVAFLTVFGVAGLILQSLVHAATGTLLPGSIASIPALLAAVPSVRVIGAGLARLIPKDETSAVASKSFIGRVAAITLGTARSGQPAEAKLKDAHGQTHYVMVEPHNEDEAFEAGTQVLLVEQAGARFQVILNTSTALIDK